MSGETIFVIGVALLFLSRILAMLCDKALEVYEAERIRQEIMEGLK